MTKIIGKIFFLSILLFGVSVLHAVAPPTTVRLELSLSNDAGPLSGYKDVKIDLRTDATSIWTESHDNTFFTEGAATLLLGETTTLTYDTLDITSPNFSLTIEGESVTVDIFTVPFALRASSAEAVSWNNILGLPDFFGFSEDLQLNDLDVSGNLNVSGNTTLLSLDVTTLNVSDIYVDGILFSSEFTNGKLSAIAELPTNDGYFLVATGNTWTVASADRVLDYLGTLRIDPTTPTLDWLTIGAFVATNNQVVVNGELVVSEDVFVVSDNTVLIGTSNVSAANGASLYVIGDLAVSGNITGTFISDSYLDNDFLMNDTVIYTLTKTLGIGTSTTEASLHIVSDNPVLIESSTTADMFVIAGNGYVGIGTNSPSANLHVSGDIMSDVAVFNSLEVLGISSLNSLTTPIATINVLSIFEMDISGNVTLNAWSTLTLTDNALLVLEDGASFNALSTDFTIDGTSLAIDHALLTETYVTLNTIKEFTIFSSTLNITENSVIVLSEGSYIQLADGATFNAIGAGANTNKGELGFDPVEGFIPFDIEDSTVTLNTGSEFVVNEGNFIVTKNGLITLKGGDAFNQLGSLFLVENNALTLNTDLLDESFVTYNTFFKTLTLTDSTLLITTNSTLIITDNASITLQDGVTFNRIGSGLLSDEGALTLNVTLLDTRYDARFLTNNILAEVVTFNNSSLVLTENALIVLQDGAAFNQLGSLLAIENNALTLNTTLLDDTFVTYNTFFKTLTLTDSTLLITTNSTLIITDNASITLQDGVTFNRLGNGLLSDEGALTLNVSLLDSRYDNKYLTSNILSTRVTFNNSVLTITENAYIAFESGVTLNRFGSWLLLEDGALTLNLTLLEDRFVSFNVFESITLNAASLVITDNATFRLGTGSLIELSDGNQFNALGDGLLMESNALTINTVVLENSFVTYNVFSKTITLNNSSLVITASRILLTDTGVIELLNDVTFNAIGDGLFVDGGILDFSGALQYVTYNVQAQTVTFSAGSQLVITDNATFHLGETAFNTVGAGLVVENQALTLNLSLLDAYFVSANTFTDIVITGDARLVITGNSFIELADGSAFSRIGDGLGINGDALVFDSDLSTSFISFDSLDKTITFNTDTTVHFSGSTLNIISSASFVLKGAQIDAVTGNGLTLIDGVLSVSANAASGITANAGGLSIVIGDGLEADMNGITVTVNTSSGLTLNTGVLSLNIGDGLEASQNEIWVSVNLSSGLALSASGIEILHGAGLASDVTGLSVTVNEASGLFLDGSVVSLALGDGLIVSNNSVSLNIPILSEIFVTYNLTSREITLNVSTLNVSNFGAIVFDATSYLEFSDGTTINALSSGLLVRNAELQVTVNEASGLLLGASGVSLNLGNGLYIDTLSQIAVTFDANASSGISFDEINGLQLNRNTHHFTVNDGLLELQLSGAESGLKVPNSSGIVVSANAPLAVDVSGLYLNLGDGVSLNGTSLVVTVNVPSGVTYNNGAIALNLGDGLVTVNHQLIVYTDESKGITSANGKLFVNIDSRGLTFDTNALGVNVGNGIEIDTGTVAVNLDGAAPLSFSSGALNVDVTTPLLVNANSIEIDTDPMVWDQTNHRVAINSDGLTTAPDYNLDVDGTFFVSDGTSQVLLIDNSAKTFTVGSTAPVDVTSVFNGSLQVQSNTVSDIFTANTDGEIIMGVTAFNRVILDPRVTVFEGLGLYNASGSTYIALTNESSGTGYGMQMEHYRTGGIDYTRFRSFDEDVASTIIKDDILVLEASTGYVGIGLADPAYTLDVFGDANISGTLTVGSFSVSGLGLTTLTVDDDTTLGSDATDTLTIEADVDINGEINSTLTIKDDLTVGASQTLFVDSSLHGVAIGDGAYDFSSGFRLYVNGDSDFDGDIYLGGSSLHTSDRRLKDNIAPLADSLDKVLKLQGVSYVYKKTPTQPQIGFIAQEIEVLFPELVRTGKDGYKSMNYSHLTAILAEAIKEQHEIIVDQSERLEALEEAVRVLMEAK